MIIIIHSRHVRQIFLTSLMMLVSLSAYAKTPLLNTDMETSSAGFFVISWQSEASQVELQEASQAQFASSNSIYTGSDKSVVISGKPDGVWYYRARNITNGNTGTWSQPIQVTVEHHTLSRASGFFALGFAVFVATLWLVVHGVRHE